MSAEPRTITLPTVDHGDVTLDEPPWCAGHTHHDPLTERADLMHAGPTIECTQLGHTLMVAQLVQHPYATSSDPRLGSRTTGVSVDPLARTLDPTDLYILAVALDSYADQLRGLADQLTGILAGGEPR